MTGVLCAASVMGSVVITPHTNSIHLSGGATYSVSVASGDLDTLFASDITVSDSGGVEPYSDAPGEGISTTGGTAGASATIIHAPTGSNNTIAFSGLNNHGDAITFTLSYDSNDSIGQHASSSYPSSGVVVIQRI